MLWFLTSYMCSLNNTSSVLLCFEFRFLLLSLLHGSRAWELEEFLKVKGSCSGLDVNDTAYFSYLDKCLRLHPALAPSFSLCPGVVKVTREKTGQEGQLEGQTHGYAIKEEK